jgi:hypothetical protein
MGGFLVGFPPIVLGEEESKAISRRAAEKREDAENSFYFMSLFLCVSALLRVSA